MINLNRFCLILWIAILLAGCVQKNPNKLNIKMYNGAGDSLGVVKVSEQSNSVKMMLDLEGLPPGVHGIHIHEIGKCEGPGFKSAGNHYNPSNKKHGLMNPKGAHAGDFSNIIVKDDGTVKAELTASDVTLKDGRGTLYGKNGTSLVIHSKDDDGMSQPAGNSGVRIACGIISDSKAKNSGSVKNPSKEGEEGQNNPGKEE